MQKLPESKHLQHLEAKPRTPEISNPLHPHTSGVYLHPLRRHLFEQPLLVDAGALLTEFLSVDEIAQTSIEDLVDFLID